jgi:hypothetical protein
MSDLETVATLTPDPRAAMIDRYRRRRADLDAEQSVLESLPPAAFAGRYSKGPTLSNVNFAGEHTAWLSWGSCICPNPTNAEAVALLAGLEAAGWKPLPLTLAKYGSWRPDVRFGLQDDLPETNRHDKLSDSWPLAPLYITLAQHMAPEANCWYTDPANGWRYKVTVALPEIGNRCRLTARREEFAGGWAYERGSARLEFPQEWHDAIRTQEGRCVAGIASSTRAYQDTEQGLSGALHFEPWEEQDTFPLTPSDILAALVAPFEARP